VKVSPFLLLASLAACRHAPKALVDPELATYMPADATVIAAIDLDRLRATPLFAKIPEPFREGSYALVGYDGKDLVTASRTGARVTVSGHAVKGNPPDLLQHATDAPIWIVARGNSRLPLAGNLANLNQLLQQTDYATVSARVADRVNLEIAGVCASAPTAQHLEENLRALASLFKFPLDVDREGAVVRATASISFEAAGKLF
jgi:hypothetical protein